MSSFYNRLSYSFGNEDWATEQKALKIGPRDRVFSVTASGDRPLNLMTTDLKELVTVDANPFQTALFDLKKTAIDRLSAQEYLAFIGVHECSDRRSVYRLLEDGLAPSSREIWRIHEKKIARGVLYQGKIERMLKGVAVAFRVLRKKKTDALFAFDNLEEQRAFIEKKWKTRTLERAFGFALHPSVTRVFAKDPGLYQYIDPEIHVANHLYTTLHSSLERCLAKESILISLIFRGRVDEAHLPPYLQPEGVKKIHKQLDRVHFMTHNVITYLQETEESSFDCFSLSDVASYMDKDGFEQMLRAVFYAARPGARFCIREFLSKQEIPDDLKPHFVRDTALEEQLNREDRCFIYRFTAGTIQK